VNHLTEVKDAVSDVRVLVGELATSLRYMREEISQGLDDCPTLFTLTPKSWSRGLQITSAILKRPFELQLWCEFPDMPHTCGDPYEVTIRPEWFKKALPILRVCKAILSLVPVVGAAVRMVANDEEWRDTLEALDFVDALDEHLALDSKTSRTTRLGADFDHRLVRELLSIADPPPAAYRGLRRGVVPGRPVMWLCEKHAEAMLPSRSHSGDS
jgi:hypothetical protein